MRHIKQQNNRNARRNGFFFVYSFWYKISIRRRCVIRRGDTITVGCNIHIKHAYIQTGRLNKKGVPYILKYKLMWDCVCDCVYIIYIRMFYKNVQRKMLFRVKYFLYGFSFVLDKREKNTLNGNWCRCMCISDI